MAGPPKSVARARTAVKYALTSRIEELADLTVNTEMHPRVLVGVSGGADSLALLATTAWVAPKMGLETVALIIDHDLQDGSAQIAERAAMTAERLGVRPRIVKASVDTAAPGGVENAARVARYRLFTAVLEEEGALALLLAHTADDQAEQVLMGLARGGGPRALAGMPRRRGAILRPFLGSGREESTTLRRVDTEAICEALEIDWWDDPMNHDPAYLRASVRHQLMPVLREVLGEHIDENLARAAELVRPDVEYLDAQARDAFQAVLRTPGESEEEGDLLHCDAHALAVLPEAIRTRVVRDASREAAHRADTPSGKSLLRRQVLAVDALVSAWHGQNAVPLPGRIEVVRRDGRLVWRVHRNA